MTVAKYTQGEGEEQNVKTHTQQQKAEKPLVFVGLREQILCDQKGSEPCL
jgi:hypothetical protein